MGFAADEPTWTQYGAASGAWTPDSLVRSSAKNERLRRFIFPGFVPSGVKSLVEAKQMLDSKSGLKDLPACGALSLLWSLIGAFDEALEMEKSQPVAADALIAKLYEASLTVTIRIRLAPEKDQLIIDNLSYAEVIRCTNMAEAAESFYVFTTRITQLSDFDMEATGPKCVTKLKALGIQWRGKSCNTALAYAILAIAPYTKNPKCVSATRRLESVCPAFFSDQTRLMRIAQQISKETSNFDEAEKTWATFMDWVRVSILTGAEGASTVGDFTVDNLAGNRNGKVALGRTSPLAPPTPPPASRAVARGPGVPGVRGRYFFSQTPILKSHSCGIS